VGLRPSPTREVELIQRRLDIDTKVGQLDTADKLPQLENAFVKAAPDGAQGRPNARRPDKFKSPA
jgi:hypothetical protein